MQENEKYFYNHDDVETILSGTKCYVIGRKGTGKSAICRHIENIDKKNCYASKLTFKNFPFNDLYPLVDNCYTQPNQYITLWKYLIYVAVCKMMIKNESIDSNVRSKLKKIFPQNQLNALARDIKEWTSGGFNLSALGCGLGVKAAKSPKVDTLLWVEKVNILEDTIAENAGSSKYYIVFDELDEDYRSIKENEQSSSYIALLTGLFKAVQSVKTTFSLLKGIKIFPIVFLRDDIYLQIMDADKNKWSDLKIELEWDEDKIKKLIAYRITKDVNGGKGESLTFDDAWSKIIPSETIVHFGDSKKKYTHPFNYIVKCTQLRPRDFIEYIRKCCDEAVNKNLNWIDESIIMHSDRAFSNYLKNEIIDEVYPVLPEINKIFQIFSTIGKWNMKVSEFKNKYLEFVERGTIKETNVDFVLETLFDFSIIGNQHKTQKSIYFFKYKHTNMMYNKEENIILHRGLFKALQIL